MFFGEIELAMDFQTVRTHLMKKTANHVKDRGRRERYPGTHFWGTDGYRVAARKKIWVPMGTGYEPEKNFAVPMDTGYGTEKKFWVPMQTPGQGVNSWKCKFSPTCILKDQVCDGQNVYNSIFF